MIVISYEVFVFFFNDTATTEIYTLSLHDALPICNADVRRQELLAQPPSGEGAKGFHVRRHHPRRTTDRKSTRLNSSHANISYAVFCLKKKKTPSLGLSDTCTICRQLARLVEGRRR